MKTRKLLAALGALFSAGCAALLNSNRPRYTGPTHTAAWHNSSIQVQTTPVIHHGVVYAITSPARLFAFDLTSGRKLWQSTVPATGILCVAGGALYTRYEADNFIGVVDAQTGAQIVGQPSLLFSKAAASDGVLYLAGNGVVAARSLSAGPGRSTELWRAAIPLTNPEPPEVAGGLVYVYGSTPSEILRNRVGRAGIYVFEASTGVLYWKWEQPGNSYDLDVTIANVTADSASTFVWIKDKSSDVFGKGVLRAFDAATGREKWKHSSAPYANPSGHPLLFDPHTVMIAEYPDGKNSFADEAGYLYRALDRATGTSLWQSRTNWKYTDSVMLDGILFASDAKVHEVLNENNDRAPDSWLTAVDLRSGKELWRGEIVELGVFTAPVAGEGMVVVGSRPFQFPSPQRKVKEEVAGLWAWVVSK